MDTKNKCGDCSRCCEYVWLPIAINLNDDYKRFLKYQGIEVLEKNGFTQALFKNGCSKLIDGKCSIYKDRPDVCKKYFCNKII